MSEITECLLKRPHLYLKNERLHCETMAGKEPSSLEIDNSHCFPEGYFETVPEAAFLQNRYTITLRPRTTDLAVFRQVSALPQLQF
jgi:hypothetical protein